jgi:hypothetical protein
VCEDVRPCTTVYIPRHQACRTCCLRYTYTAINLGMSFPKPDTHDSLDEDGSDREDRPMLLQHAESAAQPPIPRLQKLKVLVLVGIIAITFETGNATHAAPWFASLEESICQTMTQLNHTLDCTENKAVHIELAEILGVL